MSNNKSIATIILDHMSIVKQLSLPILLKTQYGCSKSYIEQVQHKAVILMYKQIFLKYYYKFPKQTNTTDLESFQLCQVGLGMTVVNKQRGQCSV